MSMFRNLCQPYREMFFNTENTEFYTENTEI